VRATRSRRTRHLSPKNPSTWEFPSVAISPATARRKPVRSSIAAAGTRPATVTILSGAGETVATRSVRAQSSFGSAMKVAFAKRSATTKQVQPNLAFNRTRYGRPRKAGLWHLVHFHIPALRRLPPRSG
jgi:hypothetical protein